MFELFPDQPVYEFPSILNIAYAMLWAIVLSLIIGITHKLTFKGPHYPTNFFQSLVLGSIVTALVMMAVGDSLARGLGVFGAMAIIRFRTIIIDPRDVLFLFASLSIGLAIGIFGYTIAFVGTIMFCLVALILHYSPFQVRGTKRVLSFSLKEGSTIDEVLSIAKIYCHEMIATNMSTSGAKQEVSSIKYQYFIILKKGINEHELLNALIPLENVSQIKISLDDIIR